MNIKVDLSIPPENIINNHGAPLDPIQIPMMIDRAIVKGAAVIMDSAEGSFMLCQLNPSWMSQGKRGRD